jgi:hypothetical protein
MPAGKGFLERLESGARRAGRNVGKFYPFFLRGTRFNSGSGLRRLR